MEPFRRKLLCSIPAAIACSLLCNACEPIGKFKGRIKGKFMLTSPTAAELNLLSSAGSTQQAHDKSAFFKISNRSFDGDVQFNEFVWSNIEFENCDFVNCSMMRGVVRNVRFVNCLFFANAWQDRIWENVFFRDCAWHGPFKMGAAMGNGLTQFEECEFIGATAEELGYGGKTEYFGSIGGTDGKVMYRKCKFERTFIYGGQVTECLSSRMSDVVIYGQDNSEILFDNILASNLVNLGNNHFSVVNVKSSTFSDRLTFEDTTIGSAVFENVIANLDLTMVKAVSVRLDHVTFKGADKAETYLQYGLSCESSKIQSLTIENCSFDGFGAELHLSGEETPEELAVETSVRATNAYSTDIDNLVIRSTPIINGHFRYMRLSKLMMEDLRISSADFSRSIIDLFVANNVTVGQNVNLGSAKVKMNKSNLQLGVSD